MNLFKKQKFSIRKFTVGTFSTVIATLSFITHTGHAAELDEQSQSAQQKVTETSGTDDTNQKSTAPDNASSQVESKEDTSYPSSKVETKADNNPAPKQNSVDDTSAKSSKSETLSNNKNSNKDLAETKSEANNVDTNQPSTEEKTLSNEKSIKAKHKRVKRDANDTSSNPQTQPDPMAINETNSGQIVNGNFTDTSNGAEIPTAATESAMDAASTIPGWQVVNSQQTQIPLVWGPKVLPSYTYVTFDKTNNKIGAVLSKYSDNLSYGRPDNNVGPIYQDIDVTPGSELQFHFIGTSMGNISGFNSARLFVYDANNPSTLLYKGTPKTSSQPFGIFKGVFNVPDNISRIRVQFESLVNVSHDTYSGHRLLKGPNNFGGGVVADVSVNTGAYLKVSPAQTEYQANSTSATSPNVNDKLNFSIENKGHSSSNKTQYKVVLPEGATFVTAENATGSFNEDTRELTLSINPIDAGTTRDVSYTVSLPTSVPIKKDFNANLIYQTEGINMNRKNGSRDLATQTPGDNNYLRYGGNNEFIIAESDQRQGTTNAPTQSVTVFMYKDAINNKISEIETELAQANQNDYSVEAWNNLQTALTNAKVVKNETDATPITDRKNQAEINNLLLNLEKAKAKFDVDKAAKARENVINSNTEATTEEKQVALTKLQNKYNEKKGEIDNLTSSSDIAPLKESSIAQINSINVRATKKAAAKQAIEAALTDRKVFIDSHYDATQEEKDVAMAKATEEANKAKALIDQATSNNDVDQAQTNGINIINSIDADVIKKANAKKAIEQAAEAKKALINQNSDATQEEKDAAIQRVTDEVRNADRLIDQSTNNDGVDEVQAHSISSINNIQPEIVKKPDAKQAIDTAVLNQKSLVNNNNEATQEEKDVALAKIDEAAKQAKAATDAATTNNAVDEATNNNTTIISGILPDTVKKAAARKAIDDAATAKKEAINNTSDATQEEKDAAIAKVDAAVTAAKQAITQATTNDNVDQEQNSGTSTITGIQPEVTKKAAARKAIDDEVVAKKAAIDTVADATDEEKQAAKDKVDAEATKAKAAIDQATTNNDVEQAKSSGVTTIEGIQPDTIKKSSAKQAIDDSANAKKAAIDNNSDATQEEKDVAKAKVDVEAAKAKTAIDQATTNDGVDQTRDLGNNSISVIQPDIVKKAAARKAIDDAATAKKQEIDQHPTATQEEKDAAKAKVDAEVQKAKDAITQANSNNDVDQVQNSETATIAGIQVDAVKKANAKQAIDDAAAKKNEIDQHPTATQEEKDAAKAKVDEEVAKAKRAIDSSTTNDAVDQAKDSGVTTINNIQPESIEKIKAKQAIDDTVTAKKNAIDQDGTTTQEEKDAAKAKVDEEATKAKQLIDQASTNDAVHETRDNEITAINKIQPEAIKKAESKQAIDDAATAKKAAIDQVSDATQEEKDAAKAKVDEEVTKAKSAIDKANTNNDVDQAKTNGTTIISSIEPEAIKKAEAKQAIDVAVSAKKQEIDNNENAIQEEKDAAKTKVDEEATKAKAAIDQASTNNGVDQAKTSGETTISSIQPEVVKKAEAKQAIDDAVTAKKAEIDQNQEATKEEKDAAKAKVDEEATKAKNNIDQSTTNNDVDQAKTDGASAITKIQPDVVKKSEAKRAIDDEVIAKKAEIDQNQEATKEEKDVAKSKVDEEVTKAKSAIDQATTNDQVDQGNNNGHTAIAPIQPETIKKPEAKQAIDEVAKAKKDLIDQTPNATKEEKDAAKSKVDEEVTKEKKEIDQASTNSDVDQVKDKGTNGINSVVVEVVKKDAAKKAIDELVKAKKSEIDNNHNATREEKDSAKSKVDEEAKKAKDNIDKGATNNDVDQAKNSSSNIIKKIQPDTTKKTVVKQTLLDQAKAKKAEIDKDNKATKEEKDAAKAEVDKIIDKANKAIDNANSNDDVDKVQVTFTSKLKEVKVKIVKKPKAQETILNVARKQKAKIDALVGLTDEQKNKAKNMIDEIVKNALEKLDNDINNNDVDSITNKAIEEIEKVNPEVSKGKKALASGNNNDGYRNNNSSDNYNTSSGNNKDSIKLPSTGKEGQNQSPLAGLALISGLFLFLKNRKRNKENS
ncbi:SasC/FmtB family protein [Staphylococcus sp. HMSC069D07]|uniref:SasC/FmtB family protein n=1 Tax=Staphylococcus sp. HMSC069D07 TaxID=1715196 RepID=UPI0008A4DA83|nr:SasC/FmtB family protein [Staphylococcus sp. HMSC069D07]OFM07457.1 YSIRK signal domain/LPXTG anchor domain surface protein [Staphylococcus sp. HMSC069D07]